ncbi:HAD family hydrolase [Halomonas sp. M20]|uniref:HAD family hydrolase n=1 Tax=Halomonas sp. M20 TaxID=2763264 RepID=UPI001D0A059B|nr:HAD family hydrolase [Halomonas sp. M20]
MLDLANLTVVAFDLDGTLIDSRLDFPAIRRELGFPEDVGLLEHIATLEDNNQVQHAHQVIHRHEMAGASAATWMPGAQQLLDTLHGVGLYTAILTRNTRQAMELAKRNLEIPIDLTLTREDCAPKPNPDGLNKIAAHFNASASQLIYVGDFLFDLQTARAAGALSCLYRYGDNHRFTEDADLVVDQLSELATLLLQNRQLPNNKKRS